MKTAISVGLVFALTLSVVPAVAGGTFQAFRALPAVDQVSLPPLSDDQLAAVEGQWGLFGQSFDIPSNILAILDYLRLIVHSTAQVNTSSISVKQVNQNPGDAVQINTSKVRQY